MSVARIFQPVMRPKTITGLKPVPRRRLRRRSWRVDSSGAKSLTAAPRHARALVRVHVVAPPAGATQDAERVDVSDVRGVGHAVAAELVVVSHGFPEPAGFRSAGRILGHDLRGQPGGVTPTFHRRRDGGLQSWAKGFRGLCGGWALLVGFHHYPGRVGAVVRLLFVLARAADRGGAAAAGTIVYAVG